MEAKDIIRPPDPRRKARVDLREVLLDAERRTRVYERVKVSNYYFPLRAEAPFVMVGDVVSRYAKIAADGLSITGYFDRPVPAAERVTVGYGRTVFVDFDVPVDPRGMARLDRLRLPPHVIDGQRQEGAPGASA